MIITYCSSSDEHVESNQRYDNSNFVSVLSKVMQNCPMLQYQIMHIFAEWTLVQGGQLGDGMLIF